MYKAPKLISLNFESVIRKFLLFCAVFISFTGGSNAQNCGKIINFEANIINHNDGTSSCTFYVDVEATSGGSKSVNIFIFCSGDPTNPYVEGACRESNATTTQYVFGPFTRAACDGTIMLNWTGHTNANCGGTTCDSQQGIPLPVKLSSLDVAQSESAALLTWVTDNEINNDQFIVERSKGNLQFLPIGEVKGSGNTNEKKHYEFYDKKPLKGINYYRIRQVDFDGNMEVSAIVSVNFISDGDYVLYPTLLNDALQIDIQDDDFQTGELTILSMDGLPVIKQVLDGSGHFTIDVQGLSAGHYMAKIVTLTGVFQKIIIKTN